MSKDEQKDVVPEVLLNLLTKAKLVRNIKLLHQAATDITKFQQKSPKDSFLKTQ